MVRLVAEPGRVGMSRGSIATDGAAPVALTQFVHP